MLEIKVSLYNSNEKSEIQEPIAEKRSATGQMTMLVIDNDFVDIDWTPDDMIEHFHALQKRETNWKAYGFDSSVLQIADLWASRNLWFQQLTHSVILASNMNCPCVVRVPVPGTWPSILETALEPLAPDCHSYVLSWLLYNQQAATNTWMAM